MLGEKSVGAAENPFDPPLMERNLRSPEATEKAIENFGEMQKSEFSALRIDMANYLLSSDNPIINGLGRVLAEDAVGKRGDNVIESTADLLKTNAFKGKLARFYQTYGVEYKAWAKENNIGFFRRSQSKQRTSFESKSQTLLKTQMVYILQPLSAWLKEMPNCTEIFCVKQKRLALKVLKTYQKI